jgi:diguanylate cyclase (GGDEF)-like protein
VLLEANAGFARVAKLTPEQSIGSQAAHLFVQPNFASLLAAPADADGEIHRGMITIGGRADARTLRGRIWRHDTTLRLLAEYDIDELERINVEMLNLNRVYSGVHFELAQANLKLQQREAQIVALSLTDSLTGLGNRRRFEQELAAEIKRAERSGQPLSAFMADLDHFKRVNDSYGHETGDRLLATFGELLLRQTRATEVGARIGGEEFVVLMPQTDLPKAVIAAERVRAATTEIRIETMTTGVTSSFGVATLQAGEPRDAFMRRLDKALYAAKHAGRNCVVTG